VADTTCVVDPFFKPLITSKVKTEAMLRKAGTMPVGVVSGATPRDITAGELNNLINKQSCKVVSGITDPVSETTQGLVVSGTFNDPEYGSQKYLDAIKFEEAYDYFKTNATKDVVVAFIDTGFDFKANADLVQFHDILEGSNMVVGFESSAGNPNLPQDDSGHGTSIASIVAAPENNGKKFVGIGGGRIKTLPVRIMKGGSTGDNGTKRLVEGIRLAVNAGAKIVNISLGEMDMYFCNPIIGEAIFRGIEKGVMFFFSAGNGYVDQNGVAVPIELKGPSDHGPQQFGKTVAPACWGSYFKGAMSVAAIDTGTNNLSTFSNYGDVVEMSAPGSSIKTQGLGGVSVTGSGTSFSAPIAAAASLVYSEFKTKNRYISPWLLEDLLLNGSPSRDSLMTVVHRGKTVDLKKLKNYLTDLSALSEEELKRIPSENRNVGKGYDPEKDIERISKILVTADKYDVAKGENLQMKADVLFTDGTLRDVTNDPRIFWTAQFQPTGETNITPRGGLFNASRSGNLPSMSKIRIIAHYNTDYEGQAEIVLVPADRKLILEKISIGGLSNAVRWGDIGSYQVTGTYRVEGTSTKITRDLTGVVTVTSSAPAEVQIIPEYRGAFRTTNSYGGRSYTLSATYEGKTAKSVIAITKRQMTLQVRNALGDPFKGQTVTLRAVLERGAVRDDLPVAVDWKSLSAGLELNRSGASEVTILTKDLAVGSYTVEASFRYRGMGDNALLKKSYTFKVVDSFVRLELLTKTPIINYRSRAVFSLRFYADNNSYVVINPAEIKWSTSDRLLPIDRQGIVSPTQGSLKGGKRARYRVEAEYLGSKVGTEIEVVEVSELSGTGTALSHLSMEVGWDTRRDCNTNAPKVGCEKIQLSGITRGELRLFAHYSDGQKREVTRFGSWSSSHPDRLRLIPDSPYVMRISPTSDPTDIYTVTALYEGMKVQSNISVVPIVDAQFTHIKTPDNKQFNDGEVIEVSDVQDISLRPEYELTDARGNVGYGGSLTPYRWSSDTATKLVTDNLDTDLGDLGNRGLLIFKTKKMTPGREYPLTYEKHYVGYGYRETLGAHFKVKVNAVVPVSFQIALEGGHRRDIPYVVSEQGGYFTCALKFSDGEVNQESCSKADFTFTRVDTGLTVSDLEYALSDPYRLEFQTWGGNNLDRTVRVNSTHRATGFTASADFRVVGITNFAHQLQEKPFPVEAPALKADSPICTAERRADPLSAGGVGTQIDPFIICSAAQLMKLPEAIKKAYETAYTNPTYVRLMANLDFSSYASMRPIDFFESGVDSSELRFDGNNYRISNYTIIDREADELGLFKTLSFVSNLIVDNPVVRGNRWVGALAGHLGGYVKNVRVIGGTVWGTRFVGGLGGTVSGDLDQVMVLNTRINYETSDVGGIGGQGSGTFSNVKVKGVSINSAGVQGLQSTIGGLFGEAAGGLGETTDTIVPAAEWLMRPSSYIFNSTFIGTIDAGLSVTGAEIGSSDVGGLIGKGALPIIQSQVKADITAAGSGVGGLVGNARRCSRYTYECLIYDSSFEGTVTGGQNLSRLSSAGGLVGNGEGGMIIKSRVKGTIRGREAVGGILGQATASYRFIDNTSQGIVSSSTETHGGFIGRLVSGYSNLLPIFRSENIYVGNRWLLTGQQTRPHDIGLWLKDEQELRNVDVAGID
jgi:hypothetical protein